MSEPGHDSEFRALVEGAPDPVAIYRGEQFVFANPAMARYLGYVGVDRLEGTTLSAFVARHVREPEAGPAILAWFIEAGSVREIRLVRFDGSPIAAECRSEPLTFGGVAARALFMRDVTERTRTLEALRRSEQNFRTIIERSPLPMCVSSTTKLVYANRALLGYLGYEDGGTMVGPTLAELSNELIHPDDRERTRTAFAHLFAKLHAARGAESHEAVRLDDVRLRSKRDGSLRFCDMHGVVVMHDGSPALVTCLHDHTERRAAADRMRLADRMSSLGTLSAGIAHEINNPLTYVIGNVELVAARLARVADERSMDLVRALQDARVGLDRIQRTVRALKTFSRADEESVGPVDVVEVLESCIEMVQSHLRHRGRLVRDYAEVSRVRGNDARIAQIFLNLLVNAAQALDEATTEQNAVTVRVRESHDGVDIQVEDTGRGIDPSDLPRVFDPFFTTKPLGEGTGLGLFVCHGIVTSLGGQIAVESTVGTGTAVRVRLPRAQDVVEAGAAAAVPPVPRRARVLVIDDEPLLLGVVSRILRDEHDVHTVGTGREAVAQLRSGERFDLVLCDLMMPGMTGADVLREVERESPGLGRRFAFVTGGAATPAAVAFLEGTPHARLQKPFTPAALLSFVREQLGTLDG
jgi:PAS domain S-box-containing protein